MLRKTPSHRMGKTRNMVSRLNQSVQLPVSGLNQDSALETRNSDDMHRSILRVDSTALRGGALNDDLEPAIVVEDMGRDTVEETGEYEISSHSSLIVIAGEGTTSSMSRGRVSRMSGLQTPTSESNVNIVDQLETLNELR